MQRQDTYRIMRQRNNKISAIKRKKCELCFTGMQIPKQSSSSQRESKTSHTSAYCIILPYHTNGEEADSYSVSVFHQTDSISSFDKVIPDSSLVLRQGSAIVKDLVASMIGSLVTGS
eukprot:scaffold220_cov169-Amphora_coffeaeformis.AAC.9